MKNLKKIAYFDENKAQALANYLEANIEDIQSVEESFDGYDETAYMVDNNTYRVLTEDEAHKAFEHYLDELIDEIGLKEFLDYSKMPIDIVVDNEENLRDWWYEDYYDYAYDIEKEKDKKYGNRLNQECIENDLIEEDDIEDGKYIGDEDLYDLLAEYLTDRLEGDFAEELIAEFDDDFVIRIIEDYCDINYSAMVDWSLNLNDYGNWLSGIDGRTMELDNDYLGFWVYN